MRPLIVEFAPYPDSDSGIGQIAEYLPANPAEYSSEVLMGLFNTLHANVECPQCHKAVEQEIQFKFGATRQYEYKLGDKLLWHGNGNDRGCPKIRRVLIDALGGPCPSCKLEVIHFDILVERDVLKEVICIGTERPRETEVHRVIEW